MKFNTLLIAFFFSLLNISVYAQMKGKLTYKLTSNDEKMGRREMDKVVFFTDKGSVEFNVDKRAEDLNQDNDESKGYLVFKNKKTDFIYKNFAKKSLYFRGLVGKTGYLTADTLLNFKWKITKEKSKIANYNCVKATTKFRGRNYVAWYTEDIALQNGPWKFCGLPGLIIKVADDQNMFSYQLTGIDLKAKFDPKTVAIPSVYANDKAITYKEYMILYKKKLEAFAKLSKVTTSGKDGSYGTVSITLPAEMEKF